MSFYLCFPMHVIKGGAPLTRCCCVCLRHISYALAGSVFPTRGLKDTTNSSAGTITWLIMPGADAGNGSLYEDDGESMAYAEPMEDYCRTHLQYTRSNERLQARLAPQSPGCAAASPWLAAARVSELQLFGVSELPKEASCNGEALHAVVPHAGPG